MNQELERVSLNLNQAIINFWKQRLLKNETTIEGNRFTATELRQFVQVQNFGTAPSSADRIMRSLKNKGVINYEVVNRSKSLYVALPLISETIKVG